MDKKYIIGIDLGATNIKSGLIVNHRLLSKKVLPTRSFPSQKKLIAALLSLISEEILLLRGKGRIRGIGLGLPGLIDFKSGTVQYFPNIKGWHNVPLRSIISNKTGLPVFIDNDANLMALAEARLGAAKGKKNVLGVTLGTGVGGGLILGGQLYRGADFAAGEIGHLALNESGPRCNCGGMACLERYIGNARILKEAKKKLGKDITLEKASALAFKGDIRAIKLWHEVAAHLGAGLASAVNLLNPEIIVIGGGVANAGGIIFANVRKVVRERSMHPQGRTVKIVRAKLGNTAGMLGAGLLVEEELRRGN